MTGVSTTTRSSGESRRRSAEAPKLEASHGHISRTPTAPQHSVHARSNVRRHVARSFTQGAVLVVGDLLTLAIGDFILDQLRQVTWWGHWLSDAVQFVFRNG